MPGVGRLAGALLLALTLSNSAAEAAFENRLRSVTSWAMSGAVDLFAVSVLDAYRHPALAGHTRLQVDLSLSRLYNLDDFIQAAGVVSVNCPIVTVTVGSSQLTGSDFYRERSYLAALSVGDSDLWRIGLSLCYQVVQFASGYERVGLISPAAGGIVALSPDLQLAISAANLNRPRFLATCEPAPTSGEATLGYRFSSRLHLFVHYIFDEHVPDRLTLGQKLILPGKLDLRFGVRTNPLEVSGGLSLQVAKFSFDYAYTDNVYLGGTHRIGLRYSD